MATTRANVVTGTYAIGLSNPDDTELYPMAQVGDPAGEMPPGAAHGHGTGGQGGDGHELPYGSPRSAAPEPAGLDTGWRRSAWTMASRSSTSGKT
ncbi:hypothetical protein DL767_001664 [Monosporascus sp. MG133]|nr:hypothetical protein DL767_001664 [Monosporascus sp. MG133]